VPEQNGQKAFLETEKGERIPCMFNPADLGMRRSNTWIADPSPGRGVARLQYGGAESGVMDMTLIFDTTADGTAVTRHTGKLVGLMDPDPSLPGAEEGTLRVRPPWVTFNWGDLHSFKSVLTDLSLRFTYFSATGVPLRASADVVLTQFEEDGAFGPQNPTSGTPRPGRVHQVRPGETLDRIAALHYGDATNWRPIATANGVLDPIDLRPGQLLDIPMLGST
jgi:hypothetical protein